MGERADLRNTERIRAKNDQLRLTARQYREAVKSSLAAAGVLPGDPVQWDMIDELRFAGVAPREAAERVARLLHAAPIVRDDTVPMSTMRTFDRGYDVSSEWPDGLAWLLAISPFIWLGIDFAYGEQLAARSMETAYLVGIFCFNCVVTILDAQVLKSAGLRFPSPWWVLLIPIYLGIRSNVSRNWSYFVVYMVGFAISMFVWIAGSLLTFPEQAASPAQAQEHTSVSGPIFSPRYMNRGSLGPLPASTDFSASVLAEAFERAPESYARVFAGRTKTIWGVVSQIGPSATIRGDYVVELSPGFLCFFNGPYPKELENVATGDSMRITGELGRGLGIFDCEIAQ